jgi:hypothetical protein
MSKLPSANVFTKSFGIIRFIKFGFLGLFFLYLFISIILNAINQKDIGFAIKELGEEFLNPILSAQEVALEIIESDYSFLESLWIYWGFYFNLYKIYLWFWVLSIFVDWLIFPKESEGKLKRTIASIVLFLFVEVLFYGLYLHENPTKIFFDLKDIFNGIFHLFTNFEFSSGSESFINFKPNNSCVDGVCII